MPTRKRIDDRLRFPQKRKQSIRFFYGFVQLFGVDLNRQIQLVHSDSSFLGYPFIAPLGARGILRLTLPK